MKPEDLKNVQEFLEVTEAAGYELKQKQSKTSKVLSFLNDITTLPFLTWILVYVLPREVLKRIDPALAISYEDTVSQWHPIILSFIVSIGLSIVERTKQTESFAFGIPIEQKDNEILFDTFEVDTKNPKMKSYKRTKDSEQ